MNQERKGTIAIILAALMWGSGGLLIRYLHGRGVSAATMIFFNLLFSVFFIYIIGKKSIQTSQIVDDFNHLSLLHRCVYSKPGLTLLNKECNCPNHNSDLKLILEITRSLTDNTLILKKANDDYYKLEPPE